MHAWRPELDPQCPQKMLSLQYIFVTWELWRVRTPGRSPELGDLPSYLHRWVSSKFSKTLSQKIEVCSNWERHPRLPHVHTHVPACTRAYICEHMCIHTQATTKSLLSPMHATALQPQAHSAEPPSPLDYNQETSALCFVVFSLRAVLFTGLLYLVCREPLNIVTCTQNNCLS